MNLLSRLFDRRPAERVELTAPLPVNRKTRFGPEQIEQIVRGNSQPPSVESILRERDQLRQQLKHATAKVEFTPGREFVCVLPFCAADEHRFRDLLLWICMLGQVPARALVVIPKSYQASPHIRSLIEEAFLEHELLWTPFDLPNEAWPIGPNWMFLTAAQHCRRQRWDFWLHEPDCIPLRPGWFEAIRDEYRACGKPYMGFVEPAGEQHASHVAGNACYHHGVFHHLQVDHLWKAWDVAMAEVLLPRAHRTPLVHQEWGKMDHPPVFHTVDDLRRIPKEAVVFHRNKDGSLIRVLREHLRAQQEQKGAKG